jgi:heme oxygenase
MLSEEIKEATKANHQVLEKKLIAKIKAIRSKQDYGELLLIFYEFFGGLETILEERVELIRLPDYLNRRKTTALADDLKKLGFRIPSIATGDTLPPINHHPEALGVLYVIEGSTLGGAIINKMIGRQLNDVNISEQSFFNGYGEKTEIMWQRFKLYLDLYLEPGEKEVITRSANNTFIKFTAWFDHSLAQI